MREFSVTVKPHIFRRIVSFLKRKGGLNQQHVSICNAVAVAGLLNATLVIPNFHFHSIRQDPSRFKDIYDKDHSIDLLRNNLRIVINMPKGMMKSLTTA